VSLNTPIDGSTRVPVVGDFDGDHGNDIVWYTPGTTAEFAWWGPNLLPG